MANRKKCPKCGYMDERGDTFFCMECGTRLEEETGFESQNDKETQYSQNTQNAQNASYNQNAQGTQYNQNAQNQSASYNQNAQNTQYGGYNMPPKKSSGSTKAVVIISCVCTAVCVIAVAAVLLFMWQKDSKTESADEADRKTMEEQDAKRLQEDENEEEEEDDTEVTIKKNKNKNKENDREVKSEPPASEISAYSDADLLAAARAYYQAGHGQMPPYAEIDSKNGNEVVIHLYEGMGDHIVTWEWYTINAYTGQGYNFTYESIDIMHPETAKVEPVESEYILPDSNSRYLQMSDLAGFTAEECRIARNELFARHGRMFNDADLQAYFNSKSWYHGTISPDAFNDNVFNEYEVANRDLIIKYEKEHGYR